MTCPSLSLLAFLLLAACGKVGAPLPPFVRIPEPVTDLAVTQTGYDLVVTWTNPARNIDGSAATDLSRVRIRLNDVEIATLSVNSAGQPQSLSVPTTAGGQRAFTLRVETARGKVSDVSNTASIVPVEVPGPVTGLSAVVDQRRITLEWGKPREHPELADAYVVVRAGDPEESQVVSETRYEDVQYEPGKVSTYQVTAIRRTPAATIRGVGPEIIAVTVEDKKPPRAPTGLDIFQFLLTWDANEETDMAGYRVFRSDRADGGFMPLADGLIIRNSFFDQASRSGLYYAVSAVDEFGNESARSAPFRAP